MDALTHRFFTRILYISLLFGALLLVFFQPDPIPALVFYGLLTALLLFHHHRYYTAEVKDPRGKLFLVAELLVALIIQYLDQTGFVEIYLFIVIGDALLAYSPRFSYPFTFIAMSAYTFMLWVKTTTGTPLDFWMEIDASLFAASIFIAVMIAARYNIQMSRKNRQMAQALELKTKELESAYEQLRSYTEELEETGDLKARQELTRQLHDQLGHLLTTAVVSLEASLVLVEQNKEGVQERLGLVVQQLQTAMQSLRSLLRGTEPDHSSTFPLSFIERLVQLLAETQMHTGITVDHNLEHVNPQLMESLNPLQRSFLYHALMEGLTNGIRHGKASHFSLQLTLKSHQLVFHLKDNGTGFVQLTPGCGLTKMREEAQRLGAALHLHCDQGCSLHIRLPLTEKTATPKSAEGR